MTATDLLQYLSQACKLLNVLFWCHFFSPLFASAAADCILNPSASRELDWSEANFTLYSIYTNSVLCCSFPPSPSTFELFFSTQKTSANTHACTHPDFPPHRLLKSLRDTIAYRETNNLIEVTHSRRARYVHAAEPLRFSGGHSFQSTACHC